MNQGVKTLLPSLEMKVQPSRRAWWQAVTVSYKVLPVSNTPLMACAHKHTKRLHKMLYCFGFWFQNETHKKYSLGVGFVFKL